jgi:hypothetical protein
MVTKIGDLEFPDFSEADRTMLIEAMTSLKDTLEPAIWTLSFIFGPNRTKNNSTLVRAVLDCYAT